MYRNSRVTDCSELTVFRNFHVQMVGRVTIVCTLLALDARGSRDVLQMPFVLLKTSQKTSLQCFIVNVQKSSTSNQTSWQELKCARGKGKMPSLWKNFDVLVHIKIS